jgi:hypothetical protein
VELPTVALRVPGGVLMLASTPVGARIFVNGTAIGPSHSGEDWCCVPANTTSRVEKDGKRSSKEVEIQNGVTHYEKFLLDR